MVVAIRLFSPTIVHGATSRFSLEDSLRARFCEVVALMRRA